MLRLKIERNRLASVLLLLSALIASQFFGSSTSFTRSITYSIDDIDDESILSQIKDATSSLSSLFNQKEGIFLWNIQDLDNLSRYGDLSDLTNGDEVISELDLYMWLEGISEDIAMQYLLLKNNVRISLEFIGNQQEEYIFNRNWIFMTAQIVNWLYDLASDDQLIFILNSLSSNRDGFGAFWNYLVRPQYNNFINERISLLGDTLVLGSKILRAVSFMPYFTYYEQSYLLLLSQFANNWWNSINAYALYDPEFAIAGIGSSKMATNFDKWITWKSFYDYVDNKTFSPADIFSDDYLDFQNYLFTSPQIANQYLTYIKKVSASYSYAWNIDEYKSYKITNPFLSQVASRIISNYASHIEMVFDKILYVFNPGESMSWTPLENTFSGYSYIWDKYFIDDQDSDNDLHQYQYDSSPLKITGLRSYQGAGDIRGLMDIYRVLSQTFTIDSIQQQNELEAFNLVREIINAQRSDGSFCFSPYFGTSLDSNIFYGTLINDANLLGPTLLPEGINTFTGSMTVMKFLLEVHDDLEAYGLSDDENIIALQEEVDNTLSILGDLLLTNIKENTFGIPKQSVISNFGVDFPIDHNYMVENIKVNILMSNINFPDSEIPDWIIHYDPYSEMGCSIIYQWDYLNLLKELYIDTRNDDYLIPIFESLNKFVIDYTEDNQYQLSSVCEGKDAIVKKFFKEEYVVNEVELKDNTGIFSNNIPYQYRDEVSPVTGAFSAETPQKIAAMILTILPLLQEFFVEPINQIIIIGFISGIILSVAVIYIRRPKYQ
ncbi:MAG: hypothetical protein FK734_06290 [Asgard group archaeon]|nr:hypothetical protein [Asgard group archaeon]